VPLAYLSVSFRLSASHCRSGLPPSGDVHWKETVKHFFYPTVKQMGAFRNAAAANAGGTGKVYVAERPAGGRAGERNNLDAGRQEPEDVSHEMKAKKQKRSCDLDKTRRWRLLLET
jgi:hypothetical protein